MMTPEFAVNRWILSEGHKANLLRGSFTKIGIGIEVEEGIKIVTAVFAP